MSLVAAMTSSMTSTTGLAELGDADLQQRVDRKYLLTQEHMVMLAADLDSTHAALTVDGRRSFAYSSIYLDTPGLDCFHAHRQGRRLRWKCRTRLYADSGRCRLEVKTKTGRGQTAKHSLLIEATQHGTALTEAAALLAESLTDGPGPYEPALLVPSLHVQHQRSTLVARDSSSRVTLDTDLSFVGPQGALARLTADYVLVETKSARGRSAADLLLWRAGIRPVSVSKYSCGVALTRPQAPDQPWRPLLTRYFGISNDKATFS